MAETKKRRYKRETIAKRLEEIKKRITEINENNYYMYKITKAVVFGSYINTNNDYLHDLDIAIELRQRTEVYGHLNSIYVELSYDRFRKSSSKMNSLYASYYGKEEVYRALKNKSTVISLHSLKDDSEAVFNDKYEVIFEESEEIKC